MARSIFQDRRFQPLTHSSVSKYIVLVGRYQLFVDDLWIQRSQLFGVATEHPPLKLALSVNFHVRHNYSRHLFVDIDSRWVV